MKKGKRKIRWWGVMLILGLLAAPFISDKDTTTSTESEPSIESSTNDKAISKMASKTSSHKSKATTDKEKLQASKQTGTKKTTNSTTKTTTDKSTALPANFVKATVTKPVDGDTVYVELENQETYKLRFIGVDTPETKHPNKGVEPYGLEASNFTEKNLLGKTVYLEKDVSNTDRYDRLLRYIWLPSAIGKVNFSHPTLDDVKNHMFNAKLVAEGYAQASTYPPDVKYQDYFLQLQRKARENQLGLWNPELETALAETPVPATQAQSAQTTKATKQTQTTTAPTSQQNSERVYVDQNGQGLIKGNINSKGEKIYHLPQGQYYDKTKIDTSKGERWFKTESEARAAGFRASQK